MTIYETIAYVMVICSVSFMLGRLYEWRKHIKERYGEFEAKLKESKNENL